MDEQLKGQRLYKRRVVVGKGKVGLFRRETGVHLLLAKYYPGVKLVGGQPATGAVVVKAGSPEVLDAAVRYIQEDFVNAAVTEQKKKYTPSQAQQLRQNGHAKLDRIFNSTAAWLFLDAQDVLHILGTPDEVQEAARQVDEVLQSHAQQSHVRQLPLQGVGVGAILGPIKDVKSRSGAKIWLDKQKKIISITGSQEDVAKAAAELKIKLRELRAPPAKRPQVKSEEEETDDREAEECAKNSSQSEHGDGKVTWSWRDDSGQWHRYGQEKIALTLETHYKQQYKALRGSASVVYTFGMESFEYGIMLDEYGNYIQVNLNTNKLRAIKRKDLLASEAKDKAKRSSKLPVYWKPHHPNPNEAEFHVLSPNSDLYDRVQRKFHKDQKNHGLFEVVMVEFVQCPRRWKAYANNRELYIDSGGRTDIRWERGLWHGTAAENIPNISAQGFLRQFGERQAYGDGVYFAVSAHYSSSSAYSVPDAQGLQRMFLARVLIGEPYRGKAGMKLPPPKTNDSLHTYDSLVDSRSNPSIYVISKDDHAYPEFVAPTSHLGPNPPTSPHAVTRFDSGYVGDSPKPRSCIHGVHSEHRFCIKLLDSNPLGGSAYSYSCCSGDNAVNFKHRFLRTPPPDSKRLGGITCCSSGCVVNSEPRFF